MPRAPWSSFKYLDLLPMILIFWYEYDSSFAIWFYNVEILSLSLSIVITYCAGGPSPDIIIICSKWKGSNAVSINSTIYHILYSTGPLLQLWSFPPEPQDDYFHAWGITFWDTRFLAISKLLIAFRHFLGNWRGAGQTRPVRPNVIYGTRVIPWNHNIYFHSFMTRQWMTQFRNVIFVLWGCLGVLLLNWEVQSYRRVSVKWDLGLV